MIALPCMNPCASSASGLQCYTDWAVVTLSTVGYGHLVPTTNGGRLFASAFMLVGLACEATLFSGLAMLPLLEHRRSRMCSFMPRT